MQHKSHNLDDGFVLSGREKRGLGKQRGQNVHNMKRRNNHKAPLPSNSG
jgi:hypothetical protein